MTAPLSAYLLSIVVPALGVFVAGHQLAVWLGRTPSRTASGVGLAAAIIALSVPVDGLPLARWLAGFLPGLSVPFTAVLAHSAARRIGGVEWLRPAEVATLWFFGLVMGLALYPAALGWGPQDPYTAGWGFSILFVAMAILSAALLSWGNRAGWVLVAAIAAWNLRLLESTNYWDYLIDPIFCLMAIPAAIYHLRPAHRRRITLAQLN